jgi:hypothetical protein
MPTNIELAEKVEKFQNLLVSWATGTPWNRAEEDEYKALRDELLATSPIKDIVPRFVHYCSDMRQFWHFIKGISPKYKGRREYLWTEFRPVIDGLKLSGGFASPSDDAITEVLSKIDSDFVHETWRTALRRRFEDPDGAITVARSLLETVCKHILYEVGISFDKNTELLELYHLTSKNLNIAPGKYSERVLKRTLGGLVVVIEGVGSLRNIFGDAHGKSVDSENPDVRHAELAVNISGALSTFLISTWESQKQKS